MARRLVRTLAVVGLAVTLAAGRGEARGPKEAAGPSARKHEGPGAGRAKAVAGPSEKTPVVKGGERGAGKAERGVGKGKNGKKRRKRGSVALGEPVKRIASLSILPNTVRCPDEMVAVAGRFCIDRYEATLVEVETHQPLSPHYPPSHRLTLWSMEKWQAMREEAPDDTLARLMPLPSPPEFQQRPFKMKAMAWPGNLPAGYASGELAAEACKNAGKRLCKEAEWVTACRGERQTDFPYGARYRQDACNVFREDHPAAILHGSPSNHHSDPRLNLIDAEGKPLLRVTGGTPSCASRWGDDAVFDMVGNVDEWVDDPEGTFAGGFYSRATRNGCDARVRTHPFTYFDYSTGVRCCKDGDLAPARWPAE